MILQKNNILEAIENIPQVGKAYCYNLVDFMKEIQSIKVDGEKSVRITLDVPISVLYRSTDDPTISEYPMLVLLHEKDADKSEQNIKS